MKTPAEINRERAATVVETVRGDEVGACRTVKQLLATTIKRQPLTKLGAEDGYELRGSWYR